MKEETELFIVNLYKKGLLYREIRRQVPYSNSSIARIVTKYKLSRRQAESLTKAKEAEIELYERNRR